MQPQHALKRRPSEEMGGGSGGKKFILAGPWDLEIPTNIILFEKQPSLLPHPHPEVEVMYIIYIFKKLFFHFAAISRKKINEFGFVYFVRFSALCI